MASAQQIRVAKEILGCVDVVMMLSVVFVGIRFGSRCELPLLSGLREVQQVLVELVLARVTEAV